MSATIDQLDPISVLTLPAKVEIQQNGVTHSATIRQVVDLAVAGSNQTPWLQDVDAANYALSSLQYLSLSGHLGGSATSGRIRMVQGDAIRWKNAANTDNVGIRMQADAITLEGIVGIIGAAVASFVMINAVLEVLSLDVRGSSNFNDNPITNAKLDSTVKVTAGLSYDPGARQSFNPDSTAPGINVGGVGADPSSLIDGDMWYDSTNQKFRARQGGVSMDVIGASGSLPLTTKGDLLARSTADVRLPVGTAGQVLTVDASAATGIAWTTSSGAGGDVVGPAASTDDAIVTFDGTTGKLIQNSIGILDENGNLSAVTLLGVAVAQALVYDDGIKQIFNPTTTNAGINIGAEASDPSAGVDGDMYFDNASGKFRVYEGAWIDMIRGGGTVTQTPWIQNIDAAKFQLGAVGYVTFADKTTASYPTTVPTIFYSTDGTPNEFIFSAQDTDTIFSYYFGGSRRITLRNNSVTMNGNLTINGGYMVLDDDRRQIFNPGNSAAGINVGANATDPTSPVNGDIYYQSASVNKFRFYENGAWVELGGGSVSPLTKKGDLYTYSTANARLPVGTADQVLVVDLTTPTGLKWNTPSSGGNVTGPTSATVNAVARYGSSGEVIKNSGIIVADNNDISGLRVINCASILTLTAVIGGVSTKTFFQVDRNSNGISDIGEMQFRGRNSANQPVQYAEIRAGMIRTQIGFEDGELVLAAATLGSQVSFVTLNGNTGVTTFNKRGIFTHTAAQTGLNVGGTTADPSGGVNGDVFYQSSTNKFRAYQNGAWVNMITSATSLLTAKGDLLTRSTVDVRLAAGTAGQVLTVDASEATGLIWATPGTGSGDVVGPATSTDDAIATFDGTTGKLIQNSVGILDENGNLSAVTLVGVAVSAALVYNDGIKQIFNPTTTNAGINIGAEAADPTAGVNGDMYFDSASGKFKVYEGAWVDMIQGGGTVTQTPWQQNIDAAEYQLGAVGYVTFADKSTTGYPTTVPTMFYSTSGSPNEVIFSVEDTSTIFSYYFGGNRRVNIQNNTINMNGHLRIQGGSVVLDDDRRQIFNPGNTVAGLNVGSNATTPSTPINGDIVYVAGTVNKLRFRQDGSWFELAGASILTTKGDLLTYSAADTRLGIGSNGQILTVDSSIAEGMAWKTPSTGGNVMGPTVSVLNAIPRYGNLLGDTLLGSAVIISNTGNMTFPPTALVSAGLFNARQAIALSSVAGLSDVNGRMTRTATQWAVSTPAFVIRDEETSAGAHTLLEIVKVDVTPANDDVVSGIRFQNDNNGLTTYASILTAIENVNTLGLLNFNVRTSNSETLTTILQVRSTGISLIGAIQFSDNLRQTFNPGSVSAGLNTGANSTDPTSPVNGDIYYQAASVNKFRFYQNGSWVELGGGGGTGDVTGPGSSTNNSIARFDGTTGKLIQNSSLQLSDNGSFTQNMNFTRSGTKLFFTLQRDLNSIGQIAELSFSGLNANNAGHQYAEVIGGISSPLVGNEDGVLAFSVSVAGSMTEFVTMNGDTNETTMAKYTIFTASAAQAGLNVGAASADPSVPVNGDMFYNSTSNKLRTYQDGAWVNVVGGGGGGGDVTGPPASALGSIAVFSSTTGKTIAGTALNVTGTSTSTNLYFTGADSAGTNVQISQVATNTTVATAGSVKGALTFDVAIDSTLVRFMTMGGGLGVIDMLRKVGFFPTTTYAGLNVGNLSGDIAANISVAGDIYYNRTNHVFRGFQNGAWVDLVGVRGPTTATENALARFDGTTGQLLQNSTILQDSSDNLDISGHSLKGVVGLLDENNLKLLTFTAVASSVDYINIAPSIATGSPSLSVVGTSNNIDLQIEGKGVGAIVIGNNDHTNTARNLIIRGGNTPASLQGLVFESVNTAGGIDHTFFMRTLAGTMFINGSITIQPTAVLVLDPLILSSYLRLGQLAAAPASADGVQYFNTALNKFQFYQNAAFHSFVQGPGAVTDNRILRFNGATGDIIQESGISIDDDHNLISVNSLRSGVDRTFLQLHDVNLATNYIEITNAVTSTPPFISVGGSDSNIHLRFQAKGNGQIVMNSIVNLQAFSVIRVGGLFYDEQILTPAATHAFSIGGVDKVNVTLTSAVTTVTFTNLVAGAQLRVVFIAGSDTRTVNFPTTGHSDFTTGSFVIASGGIAILSIDCPTTSASDLIFNIKVYD